VFIVSVITESKGTAGRKEEKRGQEKGRGSWKMEYMFRIVIL